MYSKGGSGVGVGVRLGINVSVIAWGIGIDRLAMFKLGIRDIRNLFSHDLEFLREAKV